MKKPLILVTVFFLNSCKMADGEDPRLKISEQKIGKTEYLRIYNSIKDSFALWVRAKLGSCSAEQIYPYAIDSLICFNTNANRLIGCRHLYANVKEAIADDIQYVLGEKINGKWYFFKGASMVVPRDMVKSHDLKTPLSYQQMHQIAINNIYSGYLKWNGDINESWFTNNFEGPGWGDFNKQEKYNDLLKGRRLNRQEFFEIMHMQPIRNKWIGVNKDSIIP